MISLLMFSGGIDSTYALAKLLRETEDEVLVHHIHLLTNTGRHIPEARSCKQIVDYCRRTMRPFFYSESAIDHRRFMAHGFDLIAAGFETGMVASSYALASGLQKNIDRWIVGIAGDDVLPEKRFKHAQLCCEFNCSQGRPPQLFMFPFVDVVEQVNYLPEKLYRMTWSCRQPAGLPDNPVPCGRCKACKRREKIALTAKTSQRRKESRNNVEAAYPDV